MFYMILNSSINNNNKSKAALLAWLQKRRPPTWWPFYWRYFLTAQEDPGADQAPQRQLDAKLDS